MQVLWLLEALATPLTHSSRLLASLELGCLLELLGRAAPAACPMGEPEQTGLHSSSAALPASQQPLHIQEGVLPPQIAAQLQQADPQLIEHLVERSQVAGNQAWREKRYRGESMAGAVGVGTAR